MRTWILSYPRSGNSFARYLIELVTNRPTIDDMAKKIVSREQAPMLHNTGEPIAYKRHDTWKIKPEDRIVFLLRNPKECLVRHNKGKRELNKEFYLKQMSNEDGTYCGLLNFYDKHKGDKMLIYYEDLIIRPIFETRRLTDFFNGDESKYQDMVENANKHISEALNRYPKSQTKGKGAINHSKELSRWTKIALDNLIKKHQPQLWNKYLDRYETI